MLYAKYNTETFYVQAKMKKRNEKPFFFPILKLRCLYKVQFCRNFKADGGFGGGEEHVVHPRIGQIIVFCLKIVNIVFSLATLGDIFF